MRVTPAKQALACLGPGTELKNDFLNSFQGLTKTAVLAFSSGNSMRLCLRKVFTMEIATITAPHAPTSPAFYAWLAELARLACVNLYIINQDGMMCVEFERGTHGQLDFTVEYEPIAFCDAIESLAYKAMQALERAGSHTVRETSRGIRAFLKAGWTGKYECRQNGRDPDGFDASAHRPKLCGSLPEPPKKEKHGHRGAVWNIQPRPPSRGSSSCGSAPDPWSDDELAAIGC